MNRVVICILLITLTLSIKLNVESPLVLNDKHQLECSGAIGEVHYDANNLPKGVRLNGDSIQISDPQIVKQGYYTIKLTATDSQNEIDQRLIVVVIQGAEKKSQITKTQNKVQRLVRQQNQEAQVNRVLDDLLIPSSINTNYQYPTVGYPTDDFPTGVNEKLVNPIPNKISIHQSAPSISNRNQITSDSVKATAIFQRQFNAAKALANLLSIIKQATSNRNHAQGEIAQRTKIYQDASAAQRQAQQGVIKAENDLSRINKGIESTNEQINAIRKNIDELVSNREKKKLQRQSLIEGLGKAQANYDAVIEQIGAEKDLLSKEQIDLADKIVQCDALDTQLRAVQKQFGDKKLDRANVGIQIGSAIKAVQQDAAAIVEIKRQLAQAQAALKASQDKLSKLEQDAKILDALIINIESRIVNLEERSKQCKQELAVIQERVGELKNQILPNLEIKKIQIENEINSVNKKIDTVSAQLQVFPGQISSLQTKLKKLVQNLRVLRNQIFIYQTRLRSAYQQGNLANKRVQEAKQNLDAAQHKYLHQDNIITQATRNIQIARVQNEKANQAVQDYLRQGADILPFAAAPGQTGFQPIGGGQYQIKSWDEYVEIAYGRGVKPIFVGDLNSLYSFKIQQGVDEKQAADDTTCESSNQKSISGYILQVFDDSLNMINDEGIQFTVTYAPCTKALANIQSYELAPGDIIVLKGVKELDKNEIKSTQLTCIRR